MELAAIANVMLFMPVPVRTSEIYVSGIWLE
jgi:hypothetical protein